jgi:hypothetical protein
MQEGKKFWLTDEKMDTEKTERGKRRIKRKDNEAAGLAVYSQSIMAIIK